jgi:phage FluMu protein Com
MSAAQICTRPGCGGELQTFVTGGYVLVRCPRCFELVSVASIDTGTTATATNTVTAASNGTSGINARLTL